MKEKEEREREREIDRGKAYDMKKGVHGDKKEPGKRQLERRNER